MRRTSIRHCFLLGAAVALPALSQDQLALEMFIEREMATRGIPALSIALVDGEQMVWSKGFGYADPEQHVSATPATVYRIGSVSKLFTDLAVMKLVESGQLDLDAPIQKYLPAFHPENPFRTPITLRQLMSHRSGLVREPPVGHYFDATAPSLADTVESLNKTALVYQPGTRAKYSNAGIAVVGYVLERVTGKPFAPLLKDMLLNPLQLRDSGFEPEPKLIARLSKGQMWARHRDPFPAPTFELGTMPAGSMYSTVEDLSRFLIALFRPDGIVQDDSLRQMLTPQFAPPGEPNGFGLGFNLDQFEGSRRIGHGGAIYGFATELAALPNERLGVVVVAAKDGENSAAHRIGEEALRYLLRTKKPKPAPPRFATFLGEYGWDYNVLYVYEKVGRLTTLMEWFFEYPLEEVSGNQFRYGPSGLYAEEAVTFLPEGVKVGQVLFPRRPVPSSGTTFHIKPVRPIPELQREAAAMQPPKEKGEFRAPDLVDVAALNASIHLDVRYATTNNFLQTAVYSEPRVFLQRPAAEALLKAHSQLKALGFGLLIHDGYRPWAITKVFWEATPPAQRIFVADPAQGSKHNRGCAVDLTLYDLKTGLPVEMPGSYDEMTERSFPNYPGGTSLQRWHRDLLRRIMEQAGFRVNEYEWWHFDYRDWKSYPILNIPFQELIKPK